LKRLGPRKDTPDLGRKEALAGRDAQTQRKKRKGAQQKERRTYIKKRKKKHPVL